MLINNDMDDQTLFLYLVRIPKKCLNWMIQRNMPINRLLSVKAESPIGTGIRNGLQLLYDDELNALDNATSSM
jgi:hypothetical protein